jgi:DNA-binding MarR family transcriptional regulator
MAGTHRLNPQILGRAENAHRALLIRVLDGSGVTYEGWVALSLASGGEALSRDQLVDKTASALKIDRAAALDTVTELTAAGLVEAMPDGSPSRLTESGQELHRRARAQIVDIISRIYAGVRDEDLEVAGRVLIDLTARAEAELPAA